MGRNKILFQFMLDEKFLRWCYRLQLHRRIVTETINFPNRNRFDVSVRNDQIVYVRTNSPTPSAYVSFNFNISKIDRRTLHEFCTNCRMERKKMIKIYKFVGCVDDATYLFAASRTSITPIGVWMPRVEFRYIITVFSHLIFVVHSVCIFKAISSPSQKNPFRKPFSTLQQWHIVMYGRRCALFLPFAKQKQLRNDDYDLAHTITWPYDDVHKLNAKNLMLADQRVVSGHTSNGNYLK